MKNKLLDFGLLWLRVMLGLGAMYHGWSKLTGIGIVGFADKVVAQMGLPVSVAFSVLAIGGELIGGFFIILGLWTRYAAAWGAMVWLTAFFLYHQLDPFRIKELAAAYIVAAVAIVIMGSGRFSVDGAKGGGSTPKK